MGTGCTLISAESAQQVGYGFHCYNHDVTFNFLYILKLCFRWIFVKSPLEVSDYITCIVKRHRPFYTTRCVISMHLSKWSMGTDGKDSLDHTVDFDNCNSFRHHSGITNFRNIYFWEGFWQWKLMAGWKFWQINLFSVRIPWFSLGVHD